MGFFDKLKGFTREDPDGYEGYPPYEDPDEGVFPDTPEQDHEDVYAPEQPAFTPARTQNMNISGNALELMVVKPESYKNASQIADHLLGGRTVVLNLESTNKETARRLIDFLTGAAYAIGGDIKKVSNNTYVITPGDSVAVSGDQFKSEAQNTETQSEENAEVFEL